MGPTVVIYQRLHSATAGVCVFLGFFYAVWFHCQHEKKLIGQKTEREVHDGKPVEPPDAG